MAHESEPTSIDDLEALVFGMDPGDWAAILAQKMTAASSQLLNACALQADQSRDISDTTSEDDLARIRAYAALLLAELHQTLAAMPILQMSPNSLDGLHYILTSIADLDRGSAPAWLTAKPTKQHPTKTATLKEWMLITECVEIARLDPALANVDRAVKEIARRSARKVGTIKDWHRKIMSASQSKYPQARDEIAQNVREVSLALQFGVAAYNRATFIHDRITDRLPNAVM